MKEIYLNNNATTKVDPQVLEAMLPYFCKHYGNPSNLHSFGRDAKEALEQAREEVATFINAKPEEIYFTSGGTEANNMATKGIYRANVENGNHIITSTVEHDSVLRSIEFLEKMRYIEPTYLKVDEFGSVYPDELERTIKHNTILVSIMHSNNEVGTIQPIKELCEITHKKGICFHSDAVASASKIPLDVKQLGVDLLTVSAHKFHGPKGVGALYIKEGTKIHRTILGGEQERGMRAGTENLPGIVGLGKATLLANRCISSGIIKNIESLRNYFEAGIKHQIPDVKINGRPTQRFGNISNISFAYIDRNELIKQLDSQGILVTAGAVCVTAPEAISHVLKAMGVENKYLNSQIRFGLSMYTTKEEIDYTLKILVELIHTMRSNKPIKI